MFGLSIWKILLIGGILFLIFGRKRVPELGRSAGETIREFKKGLKGEEPRDVTPSDSSEDKKNS